MQRFHSLLRVWPWLRVVAETQHLTGLPPHSRLPTGRALANRGEARERVGHPIVRPLRASPRHGAHRRRRSLFASGSRFDAPDGRRALTTLSPSRSEAKWVRIVFDGHAIGALLHHQLERLMHSKARLSFEAAPVVKMAAALLSGEVHLGFATAPSVDDRIVCKPLGERSLVDGRPSTK